MPIDRLEVPSALGRFRGCSLASPMPSPFRNAGSLNMNSWKHADLLDASPMKSSKSSPNGLLTPLTINALGASPRKSGRRSGLDASPMKSVRSCTGFLTPLSINGMSPHKSGRRGVLSPLKRTRTCSFGIGEPLAEESGDVLSNLFIEGAKYRTVSNASDGLSCPTPSHASDVSTKVQKMIPSPPKVVRPLSRFDMDWLLGTISLEELSRFHCRYFLNDCRRRFRELDTNNTGLLSLENLEQGLVEMFPTLKLELKVDGHHIPPLDKSMATLMATFDSDFDGSLDYNDFVNFIKFQQAWRAQFFLTEALDRKSEASTPIEPSGSRSTKRRFSKSASVSKLLGSRSSPLLEQSIRGKKPQGKTAKTKLGATSCGVFGQTARASSVASGSTRPSSSTSTRCSSLSSRGTASSSRTSLDSTRGAFYSSWLGVSSSAVDCLDISAEGSSVPRAKSVAKVRRASVG